MPAWKTLILGITCLALLCGGCVRRDRPLRLAKGATFDLYLVSPTQVPGSKAATDPASNRSLYLVMPAIISATDVETVQLTNDAGGTPALTVHLTPAGAGKLRTATSGPPGVQLAILINGDLVSAPKVHSPLSSSMMITGQDFTTRYSQLTGLSTKN